MAVCAWSDAGGGKVLVSVTIFSLVHSKTEPKSDPFNIANASANENREDVIEGDQHKQRDQQKEKQIEILRPWRLDWDQLLLQSTLPYTRNCRV